MNVEIANPMEMMYCIDKNVLIFTLSVLHKISDYIFALQYFSQTFIKIYQLTMQHTRCNGVALVDDNQNNCVKILQKFAQSI